MVDYYSQRKLHPRTGDVGAFSGRTTGHDVSARSSYHDDHLHSLDSHHTDDGDDQPSEAGVELEGFTSDGGLALNVGFDQNLSSSPADSPASAQHDQQVATLC